jgi:hypothetical protein
MAAPAAASAASDHPLDDVRGAARADLHRLRQQNRQLGDAFFRLRFVKQNHASDAHVAPAPCNYVA